MKNFKLLFAILSAFALSGCYDQIDRCLDNGGRWDFDHNLCDDVENKDNNSSNSSPENANILPNKLIVNDFSDDYYLEIDIDSHSKNNLVSGVFTIFNQDNNSQLLTHKADNFNLSHENIEINDDGNYQIKAKDAWFLRYEDINFDGVKDLALQKDKIGCYGSSNYEIYLNNDKSFEYSADFSEWANDYCWYEVDKKTKTLNTTIKDGYDRRQSAIFRVENNKPKLMHRETKEYTGNNHLVVTTEEFVSHELQTKKHDSIVFNSNEVENILERIDLKPIDQLDKYQLDSIYSRAVNILELFLANKISNDNQAECSGDKIKPLYKYDIQFIYGQNIKQEPIVWTKFFCSNLNVNIEDPEFGILDGGNCTFEVKVNLKTEEAFDFIVNGCA
jgi:hypothetical protein